MEYDVRLEMDGDEVTYRALTDKGRAFILPPWDCDSDDIQEMEDAGLAIDYSALPARLRAVVINPKPSTPDSDEFSDWFDRNVGGGER